MVAPVVPAEKSRLQRRLSGRKPEPPAEPAGLDEAEVDRLLTALTAIRDGDFKVRLRIPGDTDSPMARLATVVNEVVERNRHLTGELDRVRRVVGRDGRLDERLRPGNGEGAGAGAVNEGPSPFRIPETPPARRRRTRGSALPSHPACHSGRSAAEIRNPRRG